MAIIELTFRPNNYTLDWPIEEMDISNEYGNPNGPIH